MAELVEILVTDVTAELVGERREEYRAGMESGIRTGTQRTLQSNALEQLVLELTLQRAVTDVAMQRERLIAHWQAEAQWWREEHDKVHSEYCAFTKEIARRFPK